jgi:hypothetical protein
MSDITGEIIFYPNTETFPSAMPFNTQMDHEKASSCMYFVLLIVEEIKIKLGDIIYDLKTKTIKRSGWCEDTENYRKIKYSTPNNLSSLKTVDIVEDLVKIDWLAQCYKESEIYNRPYSRSFLQISPGINKIIFL